MDSPCDGGWVAHWQVGACSRAVSQRDGDWRYFRADCVGAVGDDVSTTGWGALWQGRRDHLSPPVDGGVCGVDLGRWASVHVSLGLDLFARCARIAYGADYCRLGALYRYGPDLE